MEDDIGQIRYSHDTREARPDTRGNISGCARAGVFVGAYDKRVFSTESLSSLVSRLDSLLEQGAALKSDATSRVCRIEWDGRELVAKRFNHQGLVHSLRHTLKGSRARRGWRNGRRLLGLGIPTAKPLAYVEHHRGPLIWQSYLISENVQGDSLRHVLRDQGLGPSEQTEVVRQVTTLVDHMRRHRIVHGDLKDTNILITRKGPVLMDMDGLRVNVCRPVFGILSKKDSKRLHESMQSYMRPSGTSKSTDRAEQPHQD